MPLRTEIVVPTLAEAHRARQLLRAIDSIRNQGGRAVVVLNGARFDPSLKGQLATMEGVRLLCIAEPGLPNAIHVGRTSVSTEFFGFLDDDDHLLPGALSLCESFLDSHPQCDVIVTNGIREEWGDDPQFFKTRADLVRIAADPLASLLEANWLTPCGALYRTTSVPAAVFHDLTKYAEWTDVASRLADGYRPGFIFENTFVQSDTPGSLSKHRGQARLVLDLYKRMAASLRTPKQKRLWNRRVCSLHHEIAEEELNAGNYREALRHHLRSLLHAPSVGIPRYLLYTRKFVLRPG